MFLKQSTPCQIKLGPCVDATNGADPEPSVTLDVRISKNGSTLASPTGDRHSTTPITYDADGYYTVPLDATDTNTLGDILIEAIDPTTMLPVKREGTVLAEHIYEWFIEGTGVLEVTVAP